MKMLPLGLVAALVFGLAGAQAEPAASGPEKGEGQTGLSRLLEGAPGPDVIRRRWERRRRLERSRRPVPSALLRDPKKARRWLARCKAAQSITYRRHRRAPVRCTVTVYTRRLYRALVTVLAAEKGWDDARWERFLDQLTRGLDEQVEVRIRVENLRAPRLILETGSIHARTYLTAGDGRKLRPRRWTAMPHQKLTGAGEYTVWFDRRDARGRDLGTRTRGAPLVLHIMGLEGGSRVAAINLPASLFRD